MEEEINNQHKEENVIWDLELWKRSEESKFKTHLKQLEFEFLSKLSEEYSKREDEREKELKMKLNELNVLQTRAKKRINEVEEREKRVTLMEEELKLKITEVARQLANKEEEIVYIKNRFRDERKQLEKDKQILQKTIIEKERHVEEIETCFKNYKKEIDDSPVSVLKNELNRKSLEYEDINREKLRVEKERDCFKHNCEKLKMDLIKLKKTFDGEKELIYKQKLDEIEKLRFEIYNHKNSQNEMLELQELRLKFKSMMEGETKNSQDVPIKKEYKIINHVQPKNTKVTKSQSELERLYIERENLLSSGQYTERDPLIVKLDNMIRNLEN